MEDLTRFDVAAFNGALMVVVESDLLPPDPAIVVVPLLAQYPAVTLLNPTIRFQDQPLILATRLIASVHRAPLRRAGHVRDHADAITRALDILITGV